MGVGGQRHPPAALRPGKTRYPLYRRLGGPQSRFRMVRKFLPSPALDPRTFQPVASRYTDYALPAPSRKTVLILFISRSYPLFYISVLDKTVPLYNYGL